MSLPESDRSWRERCQSQFGTRPIVDVPTLVRRGDGVVGAVAASSFKRLTLDLPTQPIVRADLGLDPDQPGVVWFEFSGASQAGRRDRVWLKVQAILTLTCQRCMGEMQLAVDETASFVCYRTEADALAAVQDEDDPSAPEPLVVQEPVDILELVQDQLILALPYVPKHESCEPAATSAGEPIVEQPRESPFKALKGFKTKG